MGGAPPNVKILDQLGKLLSGQSTTGNPQRNLASLLVLAILTGAVYAGNDMVADPFHNYENNDPISIPIPISYVQHQ